MHTIQWLSEDHRIKFQFGIHNRDWPNPIAKKEFILDYDCVSIGAADASEVRNCFINYNQLIDTLFDNSIDEKLREEMHPIENTESTNQ